MWLWETSAQVLSYLLSITFWTKWNIVEQNFLKPQKRKNIQKGLRSSYFFVFVLKTINTI